MKTTDVRSNYAPSGEQTAGYATDPLQLLKHKPVSGNPFAIQKTTFNPIQLMPPKRQREAPGPPVQTGETLEVDEETPDLVPPDVSDELAPPDPKRRKDRHQKEEDDDSEEGEIYDEEEEEGVSDVEAVRDVKSGKTKEEPLAFHTIKAGERLYHSSNNAKLEPDPSVPFYFKYRESSSHNKYLYEFILQDDLKLVDLTNPGTFKFIIAEMEKQEGKHNDNEAALEAVKVLQGKLAALGERLNALKRGNEKGKTAKQNTVKWQIMLTEAEIGSYTVAAATMQAKEVEGGRMRTHSRLEDGYVDQWFRRNGYTGWYAQMDYIEVMITHPRPELFTIRKVKGL